MTTTNKEFNARNGALIGTTCTNYAQVLGSTTGNAITIAAQGADTDISICLVPKGSGTVNVSSSFIGGAGITTVGTITTGTWCSAIGAVNGTNITNLNAANLTGTLASAVTSSSLTQVGTITTGTWAGSLGAINGN